MNDVVTGAPEVAAVSAAAKTITYVCVNKESGKLFYLASCKQSQTKILVTSTSPQFKACYVESTRVTRKVSSSTRCRDNENTIPNVPADSSSLYFCVDSEGKMYFKGRSEPTCGGGRYAVEIKPHNRPPTAQNDGPYSVAEDGGPLSVAAPGVLANDSDPDSDPITAQLVSGPSHKASFTLNANGSFSYTPAANYNGPDSFTYKAKDSHNVLSSTAATVRITVTPVNDAPTNIALSKASVEENKPAGTTVGTLSTSDQDTGDTHTYTLASGAGDTDNSSFRISGTTLQTAGPLNFEEGATRSVLVQTSDGNGGTIQKQFTITVNDLNDAPSVSVTNDGPVDEGGKAEITATATDQDTPGSSLSYEFDCDGDDTFEVGPQPENTTECSFDDSGEKTVNARVTDGSGGGDTGSTTVVVNNVSPRVTLANNGPVEESSPATISFSNQTDPSAPDTREGFRYEYNCDGSTFTSDPDYASASTSDSTSCTFDDDGTHTVRARIMDKDDGASEYTTDVAVNNVAPSVTAPADQSATEGENKSFELGSFDDPGSDGDWSVSVEWGDGSTDTFTKSAPGTLGSLNHVYADDDSDRNDGENDNDQYTVTVTVAEDGGAASASETFQVTVTNVAPAVTLSGADSANEGDTKSYTYTVIDPGDDPSPTIATSCGADAEKSNETAGAFDCTFPDGDGANGTDYTVSVSADDGGGTGSDTKTVTVANLAPTADGQTLTIDEEETKLITLSGTDPAGASDPLIFNITSLPTHGKLYKGDSTDPNDEITDTTTPVTLSGTDVTYVPDADYNGQDSFGFEACDDSSLCDEATVEITLNAINDAPVLDLNGSADGIDSTADFLEAGGPVALAPDAEVLDVDDTNIESATVTITNLKDGDAESLSADTTGTNINATYASGVLTLTGSATKADYQQVLRTVEYDNSAAPPDVTNRLVEFKVNDGDADSALATATITVTRLNEAPVVDLNATGDGIDSTASFTEDGGPVALAPDAEVSDADGTELVSAEITLTNRPDGDAESLSVDTSGTSITAESYDSSTGILALSGAASLADYQKVLRTAKYDNSSNTPDTTDRSVEFTVNDGEDESGVATSTVSVAVADDPPVAVNDSATKAEDSGATAIDVLANDTDVDNGSKTISSASDPANGTVVITGGGSGLTYEPDANYCNDPPGTNPETFTYTLSPGGSSATVSVKVTCVDDPPVAVNDSATVLEDAATTNVPVLTNDTDIDGGPKTISSASDPAKGTVVVTGGGTGLTYQPDPNYCNDPPATNLDTFTYTLNGGSEGTVSMKVTCVNDAPTAGNETFGGAIHNTSFVVDDPSDAAPSVGGAKKSITGDVLSNDSDVETPGSVSVVANTNITSTNGGKVAIEADGDFAYVSDPNDNCSSGSDTFHYTVTDNDPAGARTAQGTVTVNLSGCVWYVDNDPQESGNAGTSADPFDALSSAQAKSAANQTVFVHKGTSTYTGGFNLDANERLIGEAANLVVGSDTLLTGDPTRRPTITDTNDDVVALDDANVVRGLELDPQGTGGGIAGATGDTGGGAIDDVRIIDNGTAGTQPGLELDSTTGTFNVSNLVVNNKATGVRLHNTTTPANAVSAVFAPASQISITSDGGPGLSVSGTAAVPVSLGTSTFDDITVTNSGSGGVSMSNATGTTTFGDGTAADLSLTTTSGTTPAFGLSNAGTVSVPSGGTANVSATGGPAIDVTGTSGATLGLDDVDSTNSSGDGVNIAGLGAGTFTANNSSTITNAATIDFDLDGGTGNVTYDGTITDDVGQLVRIANTTGGTKDFNGTITDGNDGGGNGISLTNNSGATVRFDGGLTLSTGANAAFAGIGGGTVAVTDVNGAGNNPDNTLTTTTGTPLNVQNTTIHSDGITFRSIAANGSANGIALNNTGAGGLSVTGTGTTAGSGGTIQNTSNRGASFINASNVSLKNMNFTNAGNTDLDADNSGLSTGDNLATNAAIHLQSVSGTTLDRIAISGGAEQGINGNNVSNFVLSNSSITNSGNAADEDNIHFFNMSGTSSISDTTLTHTSGGGDDNLNLQTQSGTLNLTISRGSALGIGGGVNQQGSGYLFGIRGTTNATINFNDASSTNNFSGGIVADAFDSATMNLTVQNSISSGNNDQLSVSAGDSSNVDLNASGNTLSSVATGDFVVVSLLGSAFDNLYTFDARLQNNNISVANGLNADGISMFNAGGGLIRSVVSRNTITYAGTQRAINVQGGQDGAGTTNATITGNNTDIQLDGTGNAVTGILAQVAVASPSGDNSKLCADIGGAGTLANIFTHSQSVGTMPGGEVRVRQRFVTTVQLPGYGGANNDNGAVVSYLAGRNTLVNNPAATATNEVGVTAGAGGFVNTPGPPVGAPCAQPSP